MVRASSQSYGQNFIDSFDGFKGDLSFYFRWYFRKVFLVQLGDNYGFYPGARGCEAFFLKTSDGENKTAQGHFTCHGHLFAHWLAAEKGGQGRKHGNAR